MLYNSRQTYTQAVYEHLSAFSSFSVHNYSFAHVSETVDCRIDLSAYDGVTLHYSVRLPQNQISPSWVEEITRFQGHKSLFVQDEYEHTKRTWTWITRLGIHTVFTCVPEQNISRIYPVTEFPNVSFVNVLTGYVPHSLVQLGHAVLPPSQRSLCIGYRGRALPVRYGQLGREKLDIGKMVHAYAQTHDYAIDIDWREEARIYGESWYTFVASSRATLGTESGANVFDWDGDLQNLIEATQSARPDMTDVQIIESLGLEDLDGLMNQISPRIFEAIALRTALVLFKGAYSGLLIPGEHYIVLEKDGSNLADVFSQLEDGAALDAMTERAYAHVISSGACSYQSFISRVDAYTPLSSGSSVLRQQLGAHAIPLRSTPPAFSWAAIFARQRSAKERALLAAGFVGRHLPISVKQKIGPAIRRIFGI